MESTSTIKTLLPDLETFPVELKKKILQWIRWDMNPETVKQIVDLVKEKNIDRLSSLLLQRQCFGTAGIRGIMEAGFNSLNSLMIIQTTQGLAKYLHTLPIRVDDVVVIGYDGRHHSSHFAKLATNVLLQSGFKVYLFSRIVPTPFVAYATRKYAAAAGIMITASHNPKVYNGYKVYFTNGAQILSPHDEGIQEKILENLEPWDKEIWNVETVLNNPKVTDPLEEVSHCYFAKLKETATQADVVSKSDLKIVYTALHGVGHDYLTKAFETLGLKNYYPVMSQKDPDPEFSTVTFPNPEEGEGVLNEAMKTAAETNSNLIFANDPDSDRFALAELHNGSWRVFNGNEIGALFGWWLWTQFVEQQSNDVKPSDCYMISSAVSSKILETISKKEGFNWVETLTGFKWMANNAEKHTKQGKRVLFAFEEAIGFMVGTNVYDKDGIIAAATMLQAAAYLKTLKLSLTEQLNMIYQKYGFHTSYNSYYICHDLDKIERIFKRINNFDGPNTYIKEVNGVKVVRVRDLIRGYDSGTKSTKSDLPKNTMITFYFENKSVLTLRTSGTEPKIKFYSEMIADPKEIDWKKVEKSHQELVKSTVSILLEPDKNGLIAKS